MVCDVNLTYCMYAAHSDFLCFFSALKQNCFVSVLFQFHFTCASRLTNSHHECVYVYSYSHIILLPAFRPKIHPAIFARWRGATSS